MGKSAFNTRTTYANGEERRQVLIRQAFEVFAAKGIWGLSLRQIAQSLGVSHSLILHHFGSKDGLIEAVMEERVRLQQLAREELIDKYGWLDAIPKIIELNLEIPGILRLDSRLHAEAAQKDHPLHQHILRVQQDFTEKIAAGLEEEDRAGHLKAGLDLEIATQQLVALVWGLQIKWMYDPKVNMPAVIEAFLRLIKNDAAN